MPKCPTCGMEMTAEQSKKMKHGKTKPSKKAEEKTEPMHFTPRKKQDSISY